MPRGRKTTSENTTTKQGRINFIQRDNKKPEEGKIPSFIFEKILGIFIPDIRSLEIVKLKNVKVTDDNITSVSKIYGEKYSVGDEYQEWGNLYGTVGCYPTTLSHALITIKDIVIASEISKLKEETDFDKIFQIVKDTDDKILNCLKLDVIPQSEELASKLIQNIQRTTRKMEEVEKIYEEALANCNELNEMIKERRKQITKEMAGTKEMMRNERNSTN